jgi:hypothetical protein
MKTATKIKILHLYVFTDDSQENGIGVRAIGHHEATKAEKSYSAKGIRIAISEFNTPKPDWKLDTDKISYTIWATEEDAKASVLKCVEQIYEDFQTRNAQWDIIKSAIAKAEIKFKSYTT